MKHCEKAYEWRVNVKNLWIGKYASQEIFEEMALKGYKDSAAQISQNNLINGLDQLGIQLDTLNAYNVPSNYEEKIVRKKQWSRTGLSSDISVEFINIKYLSHIFRTFKLVTHAKRWAKMNESEKGNCIFVYGMQSSLLSAAIKIKKILPNVTICLIVPDLPQYMDMAMSSIKKILKKIDWINIKHQLKYIDKYVLYTRHMAEFLHLDKNIWIEMEGSFNDKDIELQNITQKTNYSSKIVMYSGLLDKRYGIIEYLNAIELIDDDDYEFWFTGSGNAELEIMQRSKRDPRIKLLGFLPSRKDLLNKQQEAMMLINTRLPSEESSSFCFPSKIFEYMITGKPVLSFKIDGIPENYFEYLIQMKSTSPKDISESIKYVANLSDEERKRIGDDAKEFILKYKTSKHQVKRIINFIGLK